MRIHQPLTIVAAIFAALTVPSRVVGQPVNPIPLINQPLVPDAKVPGGAAFKLTVNGTGFASGAVVHWNGSARRTSFVTGSQVTATVFATDIATAGTASVTVVNPSPGGGASNVAFFEVTPPSSGIALTESRYPTHENVNSVAVADFNGDGRQDLAVATLLGHDVSVFLGNGDGTFQTPVSYPTNGASLYAVTVADVNGDGKPDLVLANNYNSGSPGTVAILLGNGDGTFQSAVNYSTGSEPASVAVGDFNGDGKLDLAVANFGGSSISILLGNGDGTFQAAVNYSVGAEGQPSSVAVGDFNLDGKLDLAVADNDAGVGILLGNGDGTFQAAVNYSSGAGDVAVSVAVGDLNGDGRLDLAVVNSGAGVGILLGNGDGTFQPAVNYSAGEEPVSVAVGDFNGDSKLDLAVADQDGTSVSMLLGNGDGTFRSAVSHGVGSAAFSVAVGPFNGDGRLDLAVACSTSVSILLQGPITSLSGTALTFGNQAVGTSSAAQTVTLTNKGDLALEISGIAVTGTDASDFSQTNTCGSGVAVGASCTISVTFAPAQLGPLTAAVTITDNAMGSPQSVALSGTGISPISLPTTSLSFGNQLDGTGSAPQTATLTNVSAQPVSLGIAITGTNAADFPQTNNCLPSLPAGASCSVSLTFTPTQIGPESASVSITDAALGSSQSVALTGTGLTSGPNVTLSPTSLSHFPGTVTLTNYGAATLSISGITITGADAGNFSQTNTCGSSVGPGASCTATVTFTSSGPGTYTAALSISDNGTGSPQTVPLKALVCSGNSDRCGL